MADRTRTPARGRAALALLAAGLLAAGPLAARTCRAAGEPTGPPAPARADSTELLAQAMESGTASTGTGAGPTAAPEGVQVLEPGSGFSLRRVANPHYRALVAGGGLPARPPGMMVGSQYARARLTQRESGPAGKSTDWELAAGRDQGARRHVEIWAQGFSSAAYDQLRMLRLTSRHGPRVWSLGDVAAGPIGTLPWIQRLRGGSLSMAMPRGSGWRLLGGIVPTLTHGVTPSSGLASFLVDDRPIENGAMSFGVVGFGRRAPPQGGLAGVNLDSLAGGGAAGLYAARIASPFGIVRTTYMAQLHNLDGALAPAGVQVLEWNIDRRAISATLSDQVGTSNARQVGSERLSQAPSHEARASAQVRMEGGRAELHLAALTSSGNDVALAAQTAQVGASGNIGGAGWYSGFDFAWNRRAPLHIDERRIAVQTGRVSDHGNAVQLRVARDQDDLGRDQIQLAGEGSTSPLPGLRVSIEPRVDWQSLRLDRGMLSGRLGWPLFGPGARMNASFSVTSTRATGFRSELSEASLSLSFTPRTRDRAMVEARRYEESGVRSYETTSSYDYLADTYSNPAGGQAGRSAGVLEVSVERADSAIGVAEVLVSLDGKEFRYTDSDGLARFTNLPPGGHVVTIVERSLPAAQKVVGNATVFITVERGRAPEPLRFEVARPVRKVRF